MVAAEVNATESPMGLPLSSGHSLPASLPPSKSQNTWLSTMVPPAPMSCIAVPAQETWYVTFISAGSVHDPAPVPVLSAKLGLPPEAPVRAEPFEGYFQWPVSDCAEAPASPMP